GWPASPHPRRRPAAPAAWKPARTAAPTAAWSRWRLAAPNAAATAPASCMPPNLMVTLPDFSEGEIQAKLASRLANPDIRVMNEGYAVDAPRPAAVLLPLLRQDDEWHLLYIL